MVFELLLNCVGKLDGVYEYYLYEGVVMVVYVMYLFCMQGVWDVCVYFDGEYGKQFDFVGWLGW